MTVKQSLRFVAQFFRIETSNFARLLSACYDTDTLARYRRIFSAIND